jgi:hypothetical protein
MSSKHRAQSVRLHVVRLEDRCVPANIVVNIAGEDPNPGHGMISLRDAIAIANNNNQPDTIIFAPGITTVSITNAVPLTLTEAGQANVTTIDGGGVVTLQRSVTAGAVLTVGQRAFTALSGLTITGGTASGLVVLNFANASLDHVTVRGNSTTGGGGGIDNVLGTVQLTSSTVSGNTAGGDGGGISSGGALILGNSTIANNSAGGAGGGVAAVAVPVLTPPIDPATPLRLFLAFNSTISGNTANTGGGILVSNNKTTLTNVTVTNNRAVSVQTSPGAGGGVYIVLNDASVGSVPVVIVANTIVSGNFRGSTGTTADDLGGPGKLSAGSAANFIGGNAKLVPTAAGGGLTVYVPQPGSPVIDAGSNALAVDQNGNPLPTDQIGQPRISGPAVDIGAIEFQQSLPTNPDQLIVAGSGAGGSPRVNVFDTQGRLLFSFLAFSPAFTGGVRVAVGDVNGDSTPDIIVGAGPGGGPQVKVFDGTKLGRTQADGQLAPAAVLASFFAYPAAFTGGVNVAAGDVNDDGKADIITGAGAGGGPHVKIFNGANFGVMASFFAYASSFTGGVSVAAGDITADGHADVITGAGPGGGPQVKAFDGASLAAGGSTAAAAVANPLKNFYAFAAAFNGGVTVAAGDLNGDSKADIIAGAGRGGGPQVKAFDGSTLNTLANFYAYSSTFTGGVTVGTALFGGGTTLDIITGPGPGGPPSVRAFSGTGSPLGSFVAFDPTFFGGVFVG